MTRTKAQIREQAEQAERAYHAASQNGDWETAAHLLYKALPAKQTKGPKVIPFKQPRYRKSGGVAMETEARKGRWPAPVAVATFADGEQIRMSFWSHKDGALDWPRAKAVCERIWRKRESERRQLECLDNVTAPAIIQLYEEQTGEECPL